MRCALLPILSVLCVAPAGAQGWKPERPVELIVTCQAGCGPDGTARLIQRIWQERRIVEQPAVVVNRAGGGGAAAFGSIHQKPGDGHALVLSGAGPVVNTIMGRGVGYKELTPVAMISAEYVGVAVRADTPIRNGRELIDALKKDPQALAFGIANALGNANHQTVALALKSQGIHPGKARNVVFQSGGQSITALLGGHVQVVPASVGLWAGPLKAGQVRVIAVSSSSRLGGEFAQVPTWREQGVDAVVSVWRMLSAPPGLSPAQLAFWHDALKRTTATAEWKRDLETHYQSDEFMAGAELDRALDGLYVQLKALLTELDLAKPGK
jgi:putative tricarboxylic transport membrane protein